MLWGVWAQASTTNPCIHFLSLSWAYPVLLSADGAGWLVGELYQAGTYWPTSTGTGCERFMVLLRQINIVTQDCTWPPPIICLYCLDLMYCACKHELQGIWYWSGRTVILFRISVYPYVWQQVCVFVCVHVSLNVCWGEMVWKCHLNDTDVFIGMIPIQMSFFGLHFLPVLIVFLWFTFLLQYLVCSALHVWNSTVDLHKPFSPGPYCLLQLGYPLWLLLFL